MTPMTSQFRGWKPVSRTHSKFCIRICAPFQTHCYSENLVAPAIESGTCDL
jgi:hypothetical protein